MVSVEDTIPWAQDSDGINREKKRNPRAQAALLLVCYDVGCYDFPSLHNRLEIVIQNTPFLP
jgi:hypothetical protein